MRAVVTSVERYVRRHRSLLLATSATMFATVVGLWGIARAGPLPGEQRLTHALQQTIVHPVIRDGATLVLALGTPSLVVSTLVVGAGIVWRRVGVHAALLVFAAFGIVVVNAAAKALVGPTMAFEQIFGFATDNFPSGHTSYATAVFGAFAWLGWCHGSRDVSVVALLLIAMMGPATVATGGHVPGDVLAGYLAGGGWLLACIAASTGWHDPEAATPAG